MKKLFFLLFMLSTAVALSCSFNDTSLKYSFNEVSFKVDGAGSFTLDASFNILPDANLTRVYLISANKNMFVSYSSMPIYFDGNGYFIYLNESGNITVRGRIDYARSTKITFPSPIMRLKIATPTYSGEFYSVIGKEITLNKYQAEPEEQRITPTYNIFIGRHNSDFAYTLDLSVVTQEIKLPLYNNEIIDSVSGVENHKISGNTLILYPNKNRVTVYGHFPGNLTFFKPGLSLPGYVTIQYPGELEVKVSTSATQVDESKVSGIEVRYANRRSYEVYPSHTFSITAAKLETFPSLVFAVDNVNNKLSISENGVILQNTKVYFDNTGLDYVSLYATDLKPLYAGINGAPTFLTKKGDDMYFAVQKRRNQNLELITLDKKPDLGLFSMIDFDVPKIDYPITTFSNTIYYPKDYQLVYSSEGMHFNWESWLVLLVVFTGVLYIVIPGKTKKRRLILSFLATLALIALAEASGVFIFFGIIGYAYALAKKYKDQVNKSKKVLAIVLLLIGALAAVVVVLALAGTFLAGFASPRYSAPAMVNEGISRAAVAKDLAVEKASPTAEMGLVTKPEILPVKISLPTYSKSLSITSKMVTKDKPLHVSLLLVKGWLVKLIWLLVGSLLIVIAWWKAARSS
ncbi:MAG: hypothetical protein J7L23_00510 [Candidatus Diapherotrites archaeon]|nr:hypothetical protein [Candidatus Diapherotrites archaeon]